MDVLKPYVEMTTSVDGNNIVNQLYQQIAELERKKDEEILKYHLSLFKNFKFRKDVISNYKQDVEEICIAIVLINVIKQSYEKNSKTMNMILVGTEDYNSRQEEYSYKDGYTTEFDDIRNYIVEIKEDCFSSNCYCDVCTLGYFIKDKNGNPRYKNLINSEFEYSQDYRGEYLYSIRKRDYPIVLELEKLINTHKEELKKIITEHYKQNF